MALKILSKGKYAENQSSLPITVKQYIFADKDGKKQLYLRVKNERGETVTGVKYAIVQINARGQEIATTQVAFTNLKGVAGSLLSLNKPIEVRKECVDFKAYLISANYGNYVYSIRKSNAHLTYKEEVNRKKLATYQVNEKVGAKGRKINVIKIKAPLVGLFTTIALICVVAFMTLTGIEEFKQENRGFTLKGLEYRIESFEDKTVYVSGYFGESSKVYLADKVEDYTILGVDDYAFEDNETIKEVQIIGNLAVSKGAFKDCRNLQTVVIDGSPIIEQKAFENCYSLTSVVVENVETVEISAFLNCSSIQSMVFKGENAIKLQASAFDNCTIIEMTVKQKVNYLENNKIFNSCTIDNLTLNNLNEKGVNQNGILTVRELFATQDLNSSIKNLTVENIDAIPQYFLADSGVETLNLKNYSDSIIPQLAFAESRDLKNLNISKGITEIGSYAFYNSGIESFDCSLAESIGVNAFYNCANLKEVNLSKTKINFIEEGVFAGCSSLAQITIPNSVIQIERNAFNGCLALSQIQFPQSVTSIGEGAFAQCVGLKEIKIPNTVLNLQGGVFSGCYNVESYEAPYIGYGEGREEQLNYLFGGESNLSKLKTVRITNAKKMPVHAFAGCTSLTEAKIGGEIETVDDYAFADCTKLTDIELPSTVVSLGVGAFSGCHSLSEFNIPTKTQRIGDYAFYNCEKLREIKIPAGVMQIGDSAFAGCYKLHEVYNGSPLEIERGASTNGGVGFYAVKIYDSLTATPIERAVYNGYEFLSDDGVWYLTDCTLTESQLNLPQSVPSSGINSYAIFKYAFYKNGASGISLPSSIYEIGDCAFAETQSLSSFLVSGGNISTVGKYAFYNSSVKTLSLWGKSATSRLEFIGEGAFQNCQNLTGFELPTRLTEIQDYTFENCYALENVTIANGVTVIGQRAFYGCAEMLEIVLPQNLTEIKTDAFLGCTKLISVNNKSGITVERGSTENGWVGYYARQVANRGEAYKFDSFIQNGYKFVKLGDDYWLFSITEEPSGNIMYLPENARGNSYRLMVNSIQNQFRSGIVIPLNVISIEYGAFNNSNFTCVYYKGNREQWDEVEVDSYFGEIFFYSNCVHEYGYWKFDKQNRVTTEYDNIEWETVIEPTCTENGQQRWYCDVCKKEEFMDVLKLGHQFLDTDKCENCQVEGVDLLKQGIENVDFIDNSSDYPFKVTEEGYLESTNKEDNSQSYFTVYANEDMQIAIKMQTSTESGCDQLFIDRNGETIFVLSGYTETWYTVELKAGETLKIGYQKDGSVSAYDDCVHILRLLVIGEEEQDTNPN